MRRNAVILGLFASFVLLSAAASAFAKTAEVLPKGVSRAELEGTFYWPVDERFDPDGNTEGVDVDYNTVLGENIFPGVIPPGQNLGTSVVDFEYRFTDLIFYYQYGLTDTLSLGVKIPYYWNKTDLKEARVDTSGATVGINPAFLADPSQPPFAPVGAGGIADDDLATEVVLGSLESVYGYKPFETWSDSGLSDIEAGGRYQYHKSDRWMLALTGGAVLPTGKTDDPDNLLDVEFGRGAWGLFLETNNDYTGIAGLVLDASLKYTFLLPDSETMRVLFDVDRPIAPAEFKEKVDRNLGDILEITVSGEYSFTEAWSGGLEYEYGSKFKDKVDGDLFPAFAYDSLEDETDWTYHLVTVGVSYSTLPLFEEKKFSVPLTVDLNYENYFAGSNNFLKQQTVQIALAVYF